MPCLFQFNKIQRITDSNKCLFEILFQHFTCVRINNIDVVLQNEEYSKILVVNQVSRVTQPAFPREEGYPKIIIIFTRTTQQNI